LEGLYILIFGFKKSVKKRIWKHMQKRNSYRIVAG